MIELKCAIHPDYPNAKLPEKAEYEQDDYVELGWDIFSAVDIDINPGEVKLVPTGLCFNINPHDVGYFVKDRGGNAVKKQYTTRAGVVEASYTGGLFAAIKNEIPFDIYEVQYPDGIKFLERENRIQFYFDTLLQKITFFKVIQQIYWGNTEIEISPVSDYIFDELSMIIECFRKEISRYDTTLYQDEELYNLVDEFFEKYIAIGQMFKTHHTSEKPAESVKNDFNKKISNMYGIVNKIYSIHKEASRKDLQRWKDENVVLHIKTGDKIAQMVLIKALGGNLIPIQFDELYETPRGDNCLGSTDKK